MSSFFNKLQIEKIISLALEAGEIAALAFKDKKFSIEKKSDNSQVTTADIAVSNFLRERLNAEFPKIPVICEEGALREIPQETFFLIDPIDGTSSFISNSVEFAVNIALVQNKKAVFGLIYAPLFEGGKMIFSDEEGQVVLWENMISRDKTRKILKQVQDYNIPQRQKLRIITSARTKDADIQTYITKLHPELLQNFTVEKLSSAIKFFRLLEGDANLYLHLRESMEWDIAPGQALVELMGGKVKNLFFNQSEITIGEDLGYKKPNFLNQSFVAFIS